MMDWMIWCGVLAYALVGVLTAVVAHIQWKCRPYGVTWVTDDENKAALISIAMGLIWPIFLVFNSLRWSATILVWPIKAMANLYLSGKKSPP